MITLSQQEWLKRLNDELVCYLQTLESPAQRGCFLPCLNGVTELGRQIALGFSCFALKLYYTLGLWQGCEPQDRTDWIGFLKSYQIEGKYRDDSVTHNAFIDLPMMHYLIAQVPVHQRLINRLFGYGQLTYPRQVIIAETKQAIATLEQVGEQPERPYGGFPVTPEGIRAHLDGLDWTKPWAAGGQASAIAVFLKTQAPELLEPARVQQLLDACIHFFEHLADTETGAYFKGSVPEHSELVNGAMKVLTALDWLGIPAHYPEKLLDSCMARLPSPKGCHLVDTVYVLYRCMCQTSYKRDEIKRYCTQVLDMIKRHHNSDGGFSYHIGNSQTHYYSVPISKGFDEGDIHGTSLLTWAVAMILEILERNHAGWKVIKP